MSDNEEKASEQQDLSETNKQALKIFEKNVEEEIKNKINSGYNVNYPQAFNLFKNKKKYIIAEPYPFDDSVQNARIKIFKRAEWLREHLDIGEGGIKGKFEPHNLGLTENKQQVVDFKIISVSNNTHSVLVEFPYKNQNTDELYHVIDTPISGKNLISKMCHSIGIEIESNTHEFFGNVQLLVCTKIPSICSKEQLDEMSPSCILKWENGSKVFKKIEKYKIPSNLVKPGSKASSFDLIPLDKDEEYNPKNVKARLTLENGGNASRIPSNTKKSTSSSSGKRKKPTDEPKPTDNKSSTKKSSEEVVDNNMFMTKFDELNDLFSQYFSYQLKQSKQVIRILDKVSTILDHVTGSNTNDTEEKNNNKEEEN